MNPDAIAIRDLFTSVNEAWHNERRKALTTAFEACFDEDMVMLGSVR